MVATLGHSDNWVSLLAVLHYVLYSPSYLFLSFEIHDHVCSAVSGFAVSTAVQCTSYNPCKVDESQSPSSCS